MADGTVKAIKDVTVGDRVLATDPETGASRAEKVAALIRHTGLHHMVAITVAGGAVLTATDGHPIWDATTHTFTTAATLHVGEKLATTAGRALAVTALADYPATLTAYNLQITQIHTYYAGTTPVLVHNSCAGNPFRGINKSDEESLNSHWAKHGDGRSLEEYVKDASDFHDNPLGEKITEPTLRNGETAIKYRTTNQPGGIVDKQGNLISFWYK